MNLQGKAWEDMIWNLWFSAFQAIADTSTDPDKRLIEGLDNLDISIKRCGNQVDMFGREVRAEVVLEMSLTQTQTASKLTLQQAPTKLFRCLWIF